MQIYRSSLPTSLRFVRKPPWVASRNKSPDTLSAGQDNYLIAARRQFWESCVSPKPGSLSVEFLVSQMIRAMRQGQFAPLEKIPNLDDLRTFFQARGRPYSTSMLGQVMQMVRDQGMVFFLGGRGYQDQGRGYYVSCPPQFTVSQILRKKNLWPIPESILAAIVRHDVLSGRMRPGRPFPNNPMLRAILGAGLPNGEWKFVQKMLENKLVKITGRTRRLKDYAITPLAQSKSVAMRQLYAKFSKWTEEGFQLRLIADILRALHDGRPGAPARQFQPAGRPQDDVVDLSSLSFEGLTAFNVVTQKIWHRHFVALLTQGKIPALWRLPSANRMAAALPNATSTPLKIALEHLYFDGFLGRSKKTFDAFYWVAPRAHWFVFAVHRMKSWMTTLKNEGYPEPLILEAVEQIIQTQAGVRDAQ